MKELSRCFLLGLVLGLALAACTVTPRIVRTGEASFDGNEQNSGELYFDGADNLVVTPHWRDRYNALIADGYGKGWRLVPDAGLVPTGTNTWLVDGQHVFYFSTMNRWRKQGKEP